MLKRSAALAVAFLCAVFVQNAAAFFDPPWVTPDSPISADTISVHIHGGFCDAIVGVTGYPQITQEGNSIRLREYGFHYLPGDELCIYPVGTVTRQIGTFPPGDYTLSVEMAYIDGFGTPSILQIGTVAFTVTALQAAPAPVPAAGWLALLALAIALPVAAWAARRPRHRVLLVALACVPFGARAQAPLQPTDNRSIQVLLTNAPGAPTPTDVVGWVRSSPRSGKPPLQAFDVKSPQDGDYLIPDRASGDFLAWLNANPDSARRMLAEFVQCRHAGTMDAERHSMRMSSGISGSLRTRTVVAA